MAGVFVSYRREPAAAWAGRVADRLRSHFGARMVFIDLVDLRPGADFPVEIEETIRGADAFIAVIDPQWTDGRDRLNGPKLFREDDWVRKEIAAALHHDRVVIPVLVDRAQMPDAASLPPDISDLAHRNAIELSPTNFESDVGRLIEALEQHGIQKTLFKRIGLLRSLLIFAILGAVVLFFTLWALDIAEQRRLRRDATGPLASIGGVEYERFEVTNTRYAACVKAGRCDEPGRSRHGERYDLPDRSNLPVVSVRADQAAAFCAWIGRRLPTRSEWQVAATSDGTRLWPWGDEDPTASRLNAIFIPANGGSPGELPAAVRTRIAGLARKGSPTPAELAAVVPNSDPELMADVAQDWQLMRPSDRRELLSELYREAVSQAPSGPDPNNPDDVVPVDSDRAGATAAIGGVHHLVGNASEWSSTTASGGAWDLHSAAVLRVVGGSFADDIESLKGDLSSSSDEPLDTVGFRCVESG
jgi:hypothetical protein